MLNDEFTELLKEAKEVEKKTPKGNQNTQSSSVIQESSHRVMYMSCIFDA